MINLSFNTAQLSWCIFQGISYLLYPLIGWMADVHMKSFRVIVASIIVETISSFFLFLLSILTITFFDLIMNKWIITFFGVSILSGLLGSGMYEATAIQFGMDQAIEASSEQLSSFIYWYYWFSKLGPSINYYIISGMFLYMKDCRLEWTGGILGFRETGYYILIPSALQLILSTSSLIIALVQAKKNSFISVTKRNYIRLIYRVISYATKHSHPVRRSAFTYWEDFTPSRIDLGKEKYGGPFSTEEVEDVKTFLRLSLLLVSLLGLNVSGDSYSLLQYILKNVGCPDTWWQMFLMYINPQHIALIVSAVAIPLYQVLLRRKLERYIPNLLHRIGIGIFLCLLSYACNAAISNYIDMQLYPRKYTECTLGPYITPSRSFTCMSAHAKVIVNGTCERFCQIPIQPDSGLVFTLPILPLVLNGMGQLLSFLTVLEFICAQAPRDMKGMLIGMWYSLLSLKIVFIQLDRSDLLQEKRNWVFYNGARGVGVFMTIVAFALVCKWYRYRERDDVVNEQAIIEDLYERELLLNKESSSSSDDNLSVISIT